MTSASVSPRPRFVRMWRESVGGSQGAQRITDDKNDDWIIKPAVRPAQGLKSTITEYVGACLAQRMNLPVPDHKILYLPARTIANYQNLQHFNQGMVLGSRYEPGLDLELVESRLMLSTVAGGVLGSLRSHNYHNAIGIMIGDTWFANGDRALGVVGDQYRSLGYQTNNKGNLYFKLVDNTKNEYIIRAIDFGHAFWGNSWGVSTSSQVWPDIVLGAMRFFFTVKLLTQDYNRHSSDCDMWIRDVANIDLVKEFKAILDEMPPEWIQGGLGSSQIFSTPDWDDLVARLESRRNMLNSIMVNGYQAAAARYRSR